MHATRLHCPHCGKKLSLRQPPAPGRRILCPGCGRTFAAPAPGPLPPRDATPPPATRPAPPPPAREEPRSPPRGRLLPLVLTPVLLLAGATGLTLYLTAPEQTRETAPVPEPAPATPRPPASAARPPSPPARPPATPRPPAADVAPPSPPAWLPSDVQRQVNEASDRGAAWLRGQQRPDGTFSAAHTTGLTALPALTLLECGVKPDDPVIRKAARF